jgi:phosphate transport system substrate-binding protein
MARARWLTVEWLLIGTLLISASPARASTPTRSGQTLSGMLTIGGSTALQPLVERAANAFQKANADVQIMVSGGGSGSGRGGVCQGSLDVGMSDVPLTDSEKSNLSCSDAVQTAIAINAFAVVANSAGPGVVRALNREQMQQIFSGDVKNWSTLQGADQQLYVINRLRGSGTRQSMANYLFNGDDSVFNSSLPEEDSSQSVADAVSQTAGGISYLGLAYLNNPNFVVLGVQAPDGSVVMPTREAVKGSQWPIGGPGQAITRGQPSALAAAFVDYLIGPDFATDSAWDDLGLVAPANPAIGNQFGR